MAKARMIDYSNRQRSVKIPAEIKPLAKLLLQHIAEHCRSAGNHLPGYHSDHVRRHRPERKYHHPAAGEEALPWLN